MKVVISVDGDDLDPVSNAVASVFERKFLDAGVEVVGLEDGGVIRVDVHVQVGAYMPGDNVFDKIEYRCEMFTEILPVSGDKQYLSEAEKMLVRTPSSPKNEAINRVQVARRCATKAADEVIKAVSAL